MAVVFENPLGWIVDEERWYSSCFQNLGFRLLPALYEIDEPFRMDSQVEAINRRIQERSSPSTEETNHTSSRKRRKRHRVPEDNSVTESVAKIRLNFDHLIAAASKSNILKQQPPQFPLTNNRRARETAKEVDARARFPDIHIRQISIPAPSSRRHLEVQHGNSFKIGQLLGRTCVNRSEHPVSFNLEGGSYLMPARSRFAWGDVAEELNRIIQDDLDHYFDIIIMDPPWRNKSVKRQKTYWSQDEADLKSLPIGNLLKPGAFVAIWVTNNPQYLDYVKDTLLAEWGLTLEAKWFWFKVTTSGEPVCEFRSHFKMPFETIVFGRCSSSAHGDEVKIPDGKVIISVPSALPSRKPPLIDILKSLNLLDSMSCLELYARYLLPDTFSVGDQVIKFQCQEYFTRQQILNRSATDWIR